MGIDANNTTDTATKLGSVIDTGINVSNGLGAYLGISNGSSEYDVLDYFLFRTLEPGSFRVSYSSPNLSSGQDIDFGAVPSDGSLTLSLSDKNTLIYSSKPGNSFEFNTENSNRDIFLRVGYDFPIFPSTPKRVDYNFNIVRTNYTPDTINVYDLQDSYTNNQTIEIKQLYVNDKDGWGNIKSVDMLIFNEFNSKTVQTKTFTQWEWEGVTTWAKGALSLSLDSLTPGEYTVNFIASDGNSETKLQRKITVKQAPIADPHITNPPVVIPSTDPPITNPPVVVPSVDNLPIDIIGTSISESLVGNAKDNLIWGKEGNDNLVGGGGRDQFIFDINTRFSKRAIGVDVINDFTPGVDSIVLDRTTFTRLTGSALRPKQFASVRTVKQAKSSRALITYVRSTGALFYNENGIRAGFGKGGQFADLTNGLALSRNDISIIQ